MAFLIILLVVILGVGLFATAIGAIIEFVLNALAWLVVIGLVLGGVIMLSAGAGWVSVIPIALGIALASGA